MDWVYWLLSLWNWLKGCWSRAIYGAKAAVESRESLERPLSIYGTAFVKEQIDELQEWLGVASERHS